jgi:hypothetical protein
VQVTTVTGWVRVDVRGGYVIAQFGLPIEVCRFASFGVLPIALVVLVSSTATKQVFQIDHDIDF